MKDSKIKLYKEKIEFEWEFYALNALKNTGVAPKIINWDKKDKKYIEMENITLPNLDIFEISKEGNESILKFAKAEYNLKCTLDENGVSYYDWKAEHLFYDKDKNFLRLIDYSGDQTQKEKNRDRKKIDAEYSFIKNPNYIQDAKYKKYVDDIMHRYC